uniref:Uncharacterized protein n=1 Tax=Euplotes crassus TaxID=5936 RepID=A0A7S3KTM3_EUPCR|mmetsp:Transcript_7718/g.7270  ORF Transcript_7718/g.7270 Transcript_7718/m.7270 type:complete len:123 (+) Transcript_7718:583-951(+)
MPFPSDLQLVPFQSDVKPVSKAPSKEIDMPSADLVQVLENKIDPFNEEFSEINNSFNKKCLPSAASVPKLDLQKMTSPKALDLPCRQGDDDVLEKWLIDQKVHFKPFKAHYGHEIENIKKYK